MSMIKMTKEEAKKLVEEAMKHGYIDYLNDVYLDDYDYDGCELNYGAYQIGCYYIFDTVTFGRYLGIPEEYQDKLKKMLDLWMKL